MIALGAAPGPALAAPPANDDFANAEVLNGNRGTAFFDLTDGTAQASEPTNVGTDERTIWFSYTPTASGFASFAICDSAPEYEIAESNLTVFTGASLAALSVDSQSSGGCPDGQVNASIVGMGVSAGTTYSVQIGSTALSENAGGTLVYDFNEALPTNDDFDLAQEITGSLPQTIDADNGLASRELDEPGDDFFGPYNSLWYRWTADFDGVLSIDTCSTSSTGDAAIDSRVSMYTEDGAPAELLGLTPTQIADDGCAQPNALLTHGYFYVTSGTEYWINLANISDKFGHDYQLRLRRVVDPETTADPYIYPNGQPLLVGETYSIGDHEWAADPGINAFGYQWLRCEADGNACTEIDGETTTSYVIQPIDLGHRLRARVTAHNDAASTEATSAATELVVEPPPPTDGGGAPVDPPPPAPAVDPFPIPSPFAKSLGKIKVASKNKLKLSKLNLVCGATATGPCTGTLTVKSAKTKIKVKGKTKTIKPVTQSFKLSVAPGSKMPTTFKLSSAMLKALKAARTLKTSIAIKFGAPGFSVKSLSTSATIALK
jgi:hypothetical protein